MRSIKSIAVKHQNMDIQSKIENKNNFSPLFKQLFAATGSILLNIISGVIVAISSGIVPQFKNKSVEQITEEKASWIVSITALGMPIGVVPGYMWMIPYSRRVIMGAGILICITGCFFIAFANSILLLSIGRFIAGFYIGFATPSAYMYMLEIFQPSYKFAALGLSCTSFSVGLLFYRMIRHFLNYRMISYACIVSQLLAFVLVIVAPESPVWLIRRSLIMDADNEFFKLRSDTKDSEDELKEMIGRWREKTTCDREEERKSFFKTVVSATFPKPFVTTMVLFVVQQCTGFSVMLFYSTDIIRKLSPKSDAQKCTLYVDLIRIAVFVFGCWLLKKCDHKLLLIFSAFGTIFSLLCLAIFVERPIEIKYSSLPMLFVFTYVVFSSFGLVPIPWMILHKAYPWDICKWGNTISIYFSLVFNFIITKNFSYLFDESRISRTLYSSVCVILMGTVIACFIMPPRTKYDINNRSPRMGEYSPSDIE